MRFAVFSVALMTTTAREVSTLYTPDDPQAMVALWEEFKGNYQRSYAGEEGAARYNIFVQNLKIIDGEISIYYGAY